MGMLDSVLPIWYTCPPAGRDPRNAEIRPFQFSSVLPNWPPGQLGRTELTEKAGFRVAAVPAGWWAGVPDGQYGVERAHLSKMDAPDTVSSAPPALIGTRRRSGKPAFSVQFSSTNWPPGHLVGLN